MICGFVAVLFFSNVLDVQNVCHFTILNAEGKEVPALVLAFPWRITLGTLVTFLVALCFRTPEEKVTSAREFAATHA